MAPQKVSSIIALINCNMNQEEWMERLKREGMREISVVTLKPSVVPGEHTHEKATIHVILKGELVIEDKEGKKTYKPGDRVDFPAGTKHIASFGPQGCTMIVGVKEK